MTEEKTVVSDGAGNEVGSVGMTLAEKLATAAGRMGEIPKDKENRQQGFSYRSIETIVAKANRAFADLGVAVLPSIEDGPHYEEVASKGGTRGWRCTLTMRYEFTDGVDSKFASMPSEAIDYGDKSTSKAAQMAYKYALVEVLMIGGTADDLDADAFSPEVATEPEGPSAGEWLATRVSMFSKWNEDQRREAYKQAMEEFGFETLGHDEAEKVFERMGEMYYIEFPPSDDEAPF